MRSLRPLLARARASFSIFVGIVVGLSIVAVSIVFRALWEFSSRFLFYGSLWALLFGFLALACGLMVVRLVAGGEKGGCGTHRVVESYNFGDGFLGFRDSVERTLASVVTIGLGGSAGMEGPSLLLGGGVASSLYRLFGLEIGEARVYMLAGAAAGLSAIFRAPLTGILFALEIPFQRDLAKEAFIPATFSSVSAYLLTVMLLGTEKIFPAMGGGEYVSLQVLLHSFVLGVLAGLVSLFFVWLYEGLGRFRLEGFSGPLVGGLLLGLTGMAVPGVLGLGYDSIHAVLSGEASSWSVAFILLLLFAKVFATSVTLNMGGSGGLFVPSLFVGAMLGAAYSRVTLGRDNAVLVMAGMASVVAAGNKTLLASIALVAETTGASSIIPSLVASTVSYYVSGRSSFYRDVQPIRELEEEKPFFKILSDLGRTRLLYRIRVKDVMTRDVCLISEEEMISNAINLLKKAPEEPCFVVDSSGNLLGEVVLPDLLALPEDKWGMSLAFAPLKKPEVVSENTPLKELIEKMVETGKSHFLVMNDEGKISGYVSWIILLTRLDEVIKSSGEKRR
ncbi:MAG: chloride channel protein [Thermofilum sp.]|uniref:chloride channel protein n=1 Tax=Thermofilum sp. TaxID=1961369 RepID=UPI003167587C